MKKSLSIIISIYICILMFGCSKAPSVQVAATTAPVYEFTTRICAGTGINVGLVITENVSCLHDYTLQTSQMRLIENAETLIISGAGLEDFLADVLVLSDRIIDASESVELLCSSTDHAHEHEHEDHDHHDNQDPHIWLSPTNAGQMAKNICSGLVSSYPQYADQFQKNLNLLLEEITALNAYGQSKLQSLSSKQLITFHDGFSYLAHTYDLEILHAIEEESGSEASAAELIELCKMVESHQLQAIFTERNGSTSAADIISSETGAPIYQLDMAMSGNGYFKAMYHNIDTLKEALG